MCHGVSAGGFNGNVNSFSGLTAIPGSGPDAMQGYQALEQLSIAATPFVAGPVGGFIGDALDVGAVGTISAVAAGQMTLNEGDAVLAVVQNGQIIAEGDVGLSHSEFVARTLGTLPQGAEVVTIGKVDGQIVAITSKSFYGVQVPASANAQTAAQAAFR